MYRIIQTTLDQCGSDATPTDYLNFFALGNREAGPRQLNNVDEDEDIDESKPGIASGLNRRFMVYVHAKFMVVDDEVAIVGAQFAPLLCAHSRSAGV